MTRIDELKAVIRQLHGAEPTHVESVPLKETFRGQTAWEGTIEVFDLQGHPTASRVYAWTHETDDPKRPHRIITALHLHPIKSARDAVRAAIVQEFRSLETAQE